MGRADPTTQPDWSDSTSQTGRETKTD